MDEATDKRGGWAIGPSIVTELDVALSTVRGYIGIAALPEDILALLNALPDEWRAEVPELLGEGSHLLSILASAADLVNMVQEGDYRRATLTIRELSVEEALACASARAERFGLKSDPALPPAERLVDLWVTMTVALYAQAGFELHPDDAIVRSTRRDLERVTRILRDGDLHSRFWHWLDRFYYGFYQPWRETQAGTLEALEMQAVTALGARESEGRPPDMAWLPTLSPLRRYPTLASAVEQGGLRVFFWVEPLGLSDLWSLLPGWVLVSFAEPGALYQGFQTLAADVANRTKALADPTRLIILRMIRHFGLINTEMASYLGLARPTVSVHAKILRDAGLIESHREGREMRHEIVREEVLRLFHDLKQFLDIDDDAM